MARIVDEEERIVALLTSAYSNGVHKYHNNAVFRATIRFAAKIVVAGYRGDEQTVMNALDPNHARAQEKVKCTCHWQSSKYCLVHRYTTKERW